MCSTLFTKSRWLKLPTLAFPASPTPVSKPSLLAWNTPLAESLGIHLKSNTEKEGLFSGNTLLEKSTPTALAYAGHQFGGFSSSLGDGRAHLLGEVCDSSGKSYELQLKGSGPTRFSRGGDGRSPLGPVLREYIVSEAMHSLKVPTTRSLAVVATGDYVYRRQKEPGGILTRVADSHIRVGTFEYFAAKKDKENLHRLLEGVAKWHYPHLALDESLPLAFLDCVISKQADLIARWMSIGFVHGVMNTDNTSVAGLTIDYGPCAFLDEYQEDKVFSSIDHHKRYAYKNQPTMALWNLTRLAECLSLLFHSPQKETHELLTKSLANFMPRCKHYLLKYMLAKLGLTGTGKDSEKDISSLDTSLIETWLAYLSIENLDFTLSHRHLPLLLDKTQHHFAKASLFPKTEEGRQFQTMWCERQQKEVIASGKSQQDIINEMNAVNPLYIPRNHQIESAIRDAYAGELGRFRELCKALKTPFEEQSTLAHLAEAPSPEQRVKKTFCGT